MLYVSIEMGRHTMPVPRGTKALVERCLRSAGFPKKQQETWVLRLGRKVKGTPHVAEFRLLGLDEAKGSIRVRVKPDSNNEAHEARLIVPDGAPLLEYYRALTEVFPVNGVHKKTVVIEDTPPAPLVAPPAPQKLTLSGFSKDENKYGLVLLALHERYGCEWVSAADARAVLSDVLSLPEGIDPRATGRVLGGIARHGFLDAQRGAGKLKYKLSDYALEYLGPLPEPTRTQDDPMSRLREAAGEALTLLCREAEALRAEIAEREDKLRALEGIAERLRDVLEQ